MGNDDEKLIEKRAWKRPELEMLDISQTKGYYEFVQNGDFWKSVYVDENLNCLS